MCAEQGGREKIRKFLYPHTVRILYILVLAVDPNSVFANPDPSSFSQYGSGSSCFLNADPDPALNTLEKITL